MLKNIHYNIYDIIWLSWHTLFLCVCVWLVKSGAHFEMFGIREQQIIIFIMRALEISNLN